MNTAGWKWDCEHRTVETLQSEQDWGWKWDPANTGQCKHGKVNRIGVGNGTQRTQDRQCKKTQQGEQDGGSKWDPVSTGQCKHDKVFMDWKRDPVDKTWQRLETGQSETCFGKSFHPIQSVSPLLSFGPAKSLTKPIIKVYTIGSHLVHFLSPFSLFSKM